MKTFNTFQRNMLNTGQDLAVEIASLEPERRAFVVVESYIKTQTKSLTPSKILNKEQENLRFGIMRYKVNKADIDKYLTCDEVYELVSVEDIQSIEELEKELEKFLQDISLLKPVWYVDNPLP